MILAHPVVDILLPSMPGGTIILFPLFPCVLEHPPPASPHTPDKDIEGGKVCICECVCVCRGSGLKHNGLETKYLEIRPVCDHIIPGL